MKRTFLDSKQGGLGLLGLGRRAWAARRAGRSGRRAARLLALLIKLELDHGAAYLPQTSVQQTIGLKPTVQTANCYKRSRRGRNRPPTVLLIPRDRRRWASRGTFRRAARRRCASERASRSPSSLPRTALSSLSKSIRFVPLFYF